MVSLHKHKMAARDSMLGSEINLVCTIFQLVATPSGPGKSLEIPVEVIIGTIPLRKTEQGTPQLTVKAALQQIKEGETLDPSKLVKGQRISPRPSPQAQRAPIATAK